ncbi:U-box domain-containing 9-like [Olea europaea subsp. europaea]|uniref:RING-type E3 ubiquitin transferase n=1 Tax=Olea europaea subsp. europaea TaxID=158383 RepID=A0A8S0QI42_OLEEU|nr:U-box domain-containing 9-like [Olea europaea subsp. europaea]
MAKSAECGVVPQAKATVEMKRELERMVNAIVEEEDYTVEATDHAMGILWALKDLKLKAVMKPQELLGLDNFCFSAVPPPPPELRCPISGELMKDPVVLASGQTYDETFIQKWLKDGHQTCPTTDHVLPHTLLTPNHLVKKIISKWSKEKTSEINRKLVGETPSAIHFLIETLRNERIETRSNAAAALLVLSTLDSNKHIIGKSGAIKPLIDLIEEGHPLTVKDAAAAILSLCTVVENRAWAVTLGAVTVLTKKVMDDILIDEMLDILAILCSHQKAVEELGELGAVSCLLNILRKNVSELNKEKCVAILYTMCFSDRTKLREILAVESACETLSNVAQTGTSRARRKANGILERLN